MTISTPDDRCIVVRGRLWRRADPSLSDDRRVALVSELMGARRAVKAALPSGEADAKVLLGERGLVWWDDDAPDENRRMARNSSYAEWWAHLEHGADRD